jgi:CBS-domain-containing membrane protein
MTADVLSAESETAVADLVVLMLEHEVGAVPVTARTVRSSDRQLHRRSVLDLVR